MAETPSSSFPVPKPPPPPLKGQVTLDTNVSRQESGPMSLPPSLALPTDDELRAEQNRQTLLQRPDKDSGAQSGGIVSVNRVPITPPAAPTTPPVPVAAPVPVSTPAPTPTPAPMSEPTAPANGGTVTDVRPPVTPPPAATPPVNPLGQRFVRRPTQPSLAEQIAAPAIAPISTPTPTPVAPPPQAPNLPIATPANTPIAATPALDPNMNMLAGLDEPAAPRQRRPWLTALIVVVVLGLLGGVALWLQSSGTIYNATLQKMAGGFPKSADQALVLMRQKAATTYGLSGQASLIKSSQLPSVGSTDSASGTTAEASGTIQGGVIDGNWQVYFNWQLASDYPVNNLQGEVMRLDQKRYVYLDTLSLLVSNNNWQEITTDDWSKTAVSAPFAAVDLSGLLGRASAGQYLGPNSLTVGDKTYKVAVYQYTVDQADDYQDVTYKDGRLLIWVDRTNGQVVEYQLDELMTAGSLGDVVFESVWTVDTSATVSAVALENGAKPTSGSISGLAMELGFIKATSSSDLTTASGRDTRRRSDLLSIKEALAEYYAKTGTYPVSKTVDKTNDSKVLKGALVPSYLGVLPVDPQDPKSYYGYASDGFSFKLTSIVEDSATAGAKQGNGFYYQEITN